MNTIRRYGNVTEAGLARSVLMAAGINATLADEYAGTLGPPFAPWGIRLQVPDEDSARALEILDAEAVAEDAAEAGSEGAPLNPHEDEEPDVVCPKCGAGWALTKDELAPASFTCTECGTVIPLHEGSVAADYSGVAGLKRFLPRSDSKWVFIVVMVGYNYALQGVLLGILSPFIGGFPPLSTAHGWQGVLSHLTNSLIVYPIWQTLVLIGLIELIRAIRLPVTLQVVIPAILVSSTDGRYWWPHAIYSLPGFLIFALSYLYWRPGSWRMAAAIAVAIHAAFNADVDIKLVLNAVQSERVSRQLTGDASSWDRADVFYRKHQDLRDTGMNEDDIDALQSAIAIYPYDPNYYLGLGMAYRRAGRLREAEFALRKAMSFHDKTYEWLADYDLSYVLKDDKRYRESLDAAHEALLLAPENEQARIEEWIEYVAPKASGTSG
jgi:hypothetical protein